MKKLLPLVLSAAVLTSGPAMAQTPYLTKENVGRAIGAGVGALVGSQIGGGKGKLAAVAAGTLAGYWVGGKVGRRLSQSDRQGINYTTQQALYTGQPSTWKNPDTGMVTHVSVRDSGYKRSSSRTTSKRAAYRPRLSEAPPMEMIGDFYVAGKTSNVRGGPGTGYAIVDQLSVGEKVPVVGKVIGKDWLMVAENGVGYGFVYAPLLTRIWSDQQSASAIRIDDSGAYRYQALQSLAKRCSYVTQEIILPDGSRSAKDIQACQRVDGTWEAV